MGIHDAPSHASSAGPVNVHYYPLSYAAYDHPYGINRQLRDRAAAYCNERRDLWVVSRYDDVKACRRKEIAVSLRRMWG